MYYIEDLFDKKSVVGSRLEQILMERAYTKTELCKEAGISRPTLDKLLTGTHTSKTNYERHISKILDCLLLTPDMMLGNVHNGLNRARTIRNLMRISSEEIAKETGISVTRLKEIEAGQDATMAELRDIALSLSVSVDSLLGANFFETQIAAMTYFLEENEEGEAEEMGGFWGHVGILPCNMSKHMWFPITGSTRKLIYEMMENDYMVIPCMNNKVLYLNMQNIKEILLLDEACDEPEYTDWDRDVDCGDIPLVVYEVLEEYAGCWEEEEIADDELSPKFQSFLKELIKEKGWSEDDIYEMTELSTVYYTDGKVRPVNLDFCGEENITSNIFDIYNYGEMDYVDRVLYCCDTNGAEILFQMANISLVEFPLLKVEGAISDEWV